MNKRQAFANNIKALLANRGKSVRWLANQFEGETGLQGIPNKHLRRQGISPSKKELQIYSVIFSLPNNWDWETQQDDFSWVERYPVINSKDVLADNLNKLMEARNFSPQLLSKRIRDEFGISHETQAVKQHLKGWRTCSLANAYYYAIVMQVRLDDLVKNRDNQTFYVVERESHLKSSEILPTFRQNFNKICRNNSVDIKKIGLLTGVRVGVIGRKFSFNSALMLANYFGQPIDFFV